MARTPLYQRLLARVDMRGADECWPWKGTLNPNGYGMLSVRRGPQASTIWAHRAMFELWWHPIPDELELDHTCHTADVECRGGVECPHRRCCNPAHLEAVTHAVNVRRGRAPRGAEHFHGKKTHCPQGHPYDEANTARYDGRRVCIACRNARNLAHRTAQKKARAA